MDRENGRDGRNREWGRERERKIGRKRDERKKEKERKIEKERGRRRVRERWGVPVRYHTSGHYGRKWPKPRGAHNLWCPQYAHYTGNRQQFHLCTSRCRDMALITRLQYDIRFLVQRPIHARLTIGSVTTHLLPIEGVQWNTSYAESIQSDGVTALKHFLLLRLQSLA